MSEDSLREIRTMIIAALPFPPLPVLVARLEQGDGRLHERGETTVHTLIARCLDECARRRDPAGDRERRMRQCRAFQRLVHAIGTEGFFAGPEQLHAIFCRGAAEYLASFFPEGHPLDLQFAPFASVCRGDRAHAKMAEFLAAQSVLMEDAPPRPREHYLRLDYPQQLLDFRSRFGHAMTDEERERLEEMD